MDIDYALICDYAEAVNGKMYIMGAGWEMTTAPALPAAVRIAVAFGVRFGWDETNKAAPVIVRIEDDDGSELVRIEGQMNVGRPPLLPPGSTQLAQMAANVPVSVPRYGGYIVVVRAGEGADAVERRLPFRVAPVRPPGT
ncbi:MAG TPA: hypothetical protein PKA49_15445 [Tepidiformaceae bacterium]|nr:hypothetical protein [Tepidiformaceae bacterium]